eukprot:1305572-Rhodomonas_salina.6
MSPFLVQDTTKRRQSTGKEFQGEKLGAEWSSLVGVGRSRFVGAMLTVQFTSSVLNYASNLLYCPLSSCAVFLPGYPAVFVAILVVQYRVSSSVQLVAAH